MHFPVKKNCYFWNIF